MCECVWRTSEERKNECVGVCVCVCLCVCERKSERERARERAHVAAISRAIYVSFMSDILTQCLGGLVSQPVSQ